MTVKKLLNADIPVLYEDNLLKVSYMAGEGPFCLVTFIGVGFGDGGVDVQGEEFKKLRPELGPQLYIFDKTRSWGNRLDMARIHTIVAEQAAGREIVCLGLSMGGFLGVAMSRALGARTCIAIAPQFSVHPEIMPNEHRWDIYTDRITEWHIPSLEGQFASDCTYYCFFSGIEAEVDHLVRFPVASNVYRFLVPGSIHNTGAVLKGMGLLYPTIESCLDRRAPDALPLVSERIDDIFFVNAQASRSMID
jgi:hypothetical protein